VAGHPLLTDLVLAFALAPLLSKVPLSFGESLRKRGAQARTLCAALLLAVYFAIVADYLFSPQFLDHLEPMVASMSWAFLHGRPIYHEAASAERYSVLYGPLLYILTSIPLGVLGPSLVTAKLGACLAGVAAFGFLYAATAALGLSHSWRLALLGWLALALLTFPGASYWIRSEPWMMMLASAALFSAVRLRPLPAALACGALTGLLAGLKIHSGIYAIPAWAWVFQRGGRRTIAPAAVAMCAAFFAPFIAAPAQISLARMVFWIRETSHHGVSLGVGLSVFEWGLFFAAAAGPPLLANRKNRLYWSAVGVTFLLACGSGSLVGAGRHHLIPWIPSLVFGFGTLLTEPPVRWHSWRAPFAWASVLSMLVIACHHTGDAISESRRFPGKEITAELEEIQARHPGAAIEMGYGSNYALSFYRPLLVFASGEYLLDGAALMDMQPLGMAVTPATRERIKQCKPGLWLFPRGEEPFGLRHLAPPYVPIFDESLKREFRERFVLAETGRFYSLWECRR
jgi:hypothetical protein